MSKESLQKQADRADSIADQTVDESMKEILRDAAGDYREEAGEKPSAYALFRGDTRLARTYRTEQEVIRAALSEGLIPEMDPPAESGAQVLPSGYHIEKVEQPYEPQPDWKLPREIS
jgi:hypothetical protein